MKISREASCTLISTILLLGFTHANAQSCDIPKNNKLTNDAGWEIPDLKKFDKDPVGHQIIDGIAITSQHYSRRQSVDIELSSFKVDENCNYKVFVRKLSTRDITSISASGKIFAYQALYQPYSDVATTQQIGKKTRKFNLRRYMGSVSSIFYIDEDGDGKFETRYASLKMPDLPLWVKKQK